MSRGVKIFTEFESLRTICFFWVATYHFTILFSFWKSKQEIVPFFETYPWFSIGESGHFGPDVFFGLSGLFLTKKMLDYSRESTKNVIGIEWCLKAWFHRLQRVYPLYILIGIISMIEFTPKLPNVMALVFMYIHLIANSEPVELAVWLWSVGMDNLLQFFWMAIFSILIRLEMATLKSVSRLLFISLFIRLIMNFEIFFGLLHQVRLPFNMLSTDWTVEPMPISAKITHHFEYYAFFGRLPQFLIGACFAFLLSNNNEISESNENDKNGKKKEEPVGALFWLLASGISLVGWCLVCNRGGSTSQSDEGSCFGGDVILQWIWNALSRPAITCSALCFAFASKLLADSKQDGVNDLVRKFYFSSFLVNSGKYTWSGYCTHPIVVALILMGIPKSIPLNPFTIILILLLTLICVHFVAKFTYLWFEIPVSNFLQKRFNSNKPNQIKSN